MISTLLTLFAVLVGCDGTPMPISTFEYDDAVSAARKLDNPDIYRAALLQFATQREILALNEIFSASAPFDAMRAYYKLSLLESGLGRDAEAQRYLLEAMRVCESVRDACTESDLREYEMRFDEFEKDRDLQW